MPVVLEILIWLAVIGVGGYLLLVAAYYSLLFTLMFSILLLPSILGLTLGAIVGWGFGLANIGVLLAVAGMVYNFWEWGNWGWYKSPIYEWLDRLYRSYERLGGADNDLPNSIQMRGKIARYDKDGKVTGYQDRE